MFQNFISLQKCIVLVLMITLNASAQSITITGTVVDSLTSAGIGGAIIKLVEFPQCSTITTQNGSFTLNGNPAGVTPEHGKLPASGIVSLAGNSLRVAGTIATPVAVDVFSCNGSRIYHNEKSGNAHGTVAFSDLWKIPGLYFVKITFNGQEQILSSPGSVQVTSKLVSSHVSSSSSLFKLAATYTLQITASGYVQKSISLTSTKTDVGTIKLVKNQEQTGVWTNVTPAGVDANDVGSGYGMGSIVGDPSRPSDMYVGGSASGLWKSTDYGKTWNKINANVPNQPRGVLIAVAGTTPATIWMADFRYVWKSTDGGVTFKSSPMPSEVQVGFYSLTVDPYDNNHLLTGLHEAGGVYESVDGGATWHSAGSGTLGGGVSVYPFFINTRDSATTRKTWLAIGQNGSSPGRTTDGGAHWVTPTGINGIEHPHGNAQIFQKDSVIFLGGVSSSSQGVFKSTNYGVSWTRVDSGSKPEAIVWASAKNVYAMYAWACNCPVTLNFEKAALPEGTSWTPVTFTNGPAIGPNSMVSVFDGSHYVFAGCMWNNGLWRYVEP